MLVSCLAILALRGATIDIHPDDFSNYCILLDEGMLNSYEFDHNNKSSAW